MDAYPYNLILAVATASATLFLGFLPTKTLSSAFFAREVTKALLAWALIAFLSPAKIVHYPLFYAFLCFASWWQFRADKLLNGKMWLSVASGLGISAGVIIILNASPRALPPGLTPLNETLLLASIYLGGAVIGLAYVCSALIQGADLKPASNSNALHRYLGILLFLTVARTAIVGLELLLPPSPATSQIIGFSAKLSDGDPYNYHTSLQPYGPLLLLPVLLLVAFAFFAKRAASSSSRVQPIVFLNALVLLGFFTEVLARFLIL